MKCHIVRDRVPSVHRAHTPGQLHRDAAGIDCGATEHVVAVPPDRDGPRSRRSRPSPTISTASRLAEGLWHHLRRDGIHRASIGSRSSRFSKLAGFEVTPGQRPAHQETSRAEERCARQRVAARPPHRRAAARQLPTGRRHRGLRAYLRHRTTLIDTAATYVQRMQKALVQMNLQLPIVVSDITGVTGLRILRDIVAGERDPHHLARHRDYRCHASEADDRRSADRALSPRAPLRPDSRTSNSSSLPAAPRDVRRAHQGCPRRPGRHATPVASPNARRATPSRNPETTSRASTNAPRSAN